MSLSGKKTALALNAESQLNVSLGLCINPQAIAYQGSWTPAMPYSTFTGASYTAGTLVNNTALKKLTDALPNFYNMATSKICMVVYRNLLKIGRPIDSRSNNHRINCPALGNSRPDTFKTSFAGYGTFKPGQMTDEYYNITTTTANVGLTESVYPPYKYPLEGTYSYIYNNWSSLTPTPGAPLTCNQNTFQAWTQDYQYKHEYAWIIGWPGRVIFQNKTSTDPQEAYDPDQDGDTYAAAYFPRPDLAGTQPWRARDSGKIEYDEYFKFGFLSTVARQAYYEFWSEKQTRRTNQYLEFVKSFQQCYGFKELTNRKISSFQNSKTFLKGNYSNINDITTSDIAGVSLSFKLFGNDLIKLGLSLNLANIDTFGLPSKFLLNLQRNNALTESIKMSLLLVELTTDEISKILLPTYTPTPEQEKKIYESFLLIKGDDLNDIKIILNIGTTGLESLADLINPKKMFPTSWQTLTVPQYSITTPTAKTYDFIYNGGNVNTRILNWGEYLNNILPDDLAKACGAFMCSMNQIKNIKQMNIISFGQVVSNLEVVNKDLPLVNGTNGVPVNTDLANQGSELFALGSGNAGNYKFADFFGAMSGQPYNSYYKNIEPLISKLQTTALQNVYTKLYQLSLGNYWALLSKGKGYTDIYINPSSSVPSSCAYTLYTVSNNYNIGTTLINCTSGVDNVLSPGNVIAFSTNDSLLSPSTTYTVSSVTSTSITLSSPLTVALTSGDKIYIQIANYGTYPNITPNAGAVQDLIDAANLEILNIQNTNGDNVEKLNYWWDKVGNQLFFEQRAIPFAVTDNSGIYQGSNRSDIDSFIRAIENYASDTEYAEVASILEAISDITDIGGQSIVALMREARNAKRVSLTGGTLDNDIPDTMNVNQASAVAKVVDGKIDEVIVTYPGNNYCGIIPNAIVYPQGGVFGGTGSGATINATVDESCGIDAIAVDNPGLNYSEPSNVYIAPPPEVNPIPLTIYPGSLITTPVIVPEPLRTNSDASYNVNQAIDEVTICNCECWNQ